MRAELMNIDGRTTGTVTPRDGVAVCDPPNLLSDMRVIAPAPRLVTPEEDEE